MTSQGHEAPATGAVHAAFLAAGIGSFAMGFITVLHEAGVYSAPTIYGPAGGVSGRTTFAVAAWLIAWAVLHRLWRRRPIRGAVPGVACALLVLAGLLCTFPPLWQLL